MNKTKELAVVPFRPGGSAPCGRMSAPVRLHRSREAAESPSRSEEATWLHLEMLRFTL